MDQQQIIAQLEARAKALGASISQICEDAGIHPTTFSRWKLSERNPDPVGATMNSLTKLDQALTAREVPSQNAAA